ncbi:hypothetical protein DCS_05024 [Drechmeria coniospora]|uniref:Uncharacterized protein n=1 Tax=Drechmeria coniospora TaxID=98403 RepID=A0A151GLU7_DRECN|nr:hypothetical protein DCS_05024 [Drechmeria coniospora]KYK58011.1 hypothetical protein DCS_05024 [Drechmeria coniospora]
MKFTRAVTFAAVASATLLDRRDITTLNDTLTNILSKATVLTTRTSNITGDFEALVASSHALIQSLRDGVVAINSTLPNPVLDEDCSLIDFLPAFQNVWNSLRDSTRAVKLEIESTGACRFVGHCIKEIMSSSMTLQQLIRDRLPRHCKFPTKQKFHELGISSPEGRDIVLCMWDRFKKEIDAFRLGFEKPSCTRFGTARNRLFM